MWLRCWRRYWVRASGNTTSGADRSEGRALFRSGGRGLFLCLLCRPLVSRSFDDYAPEEPRGSDLRADEFTAFRKPVHVLRTDTEDFGCPVEVEHLREAAVGVALFDHGVTLPDAVEDSPPSGVALSLAG